MLDVHVYIPEKYKALIGEVMESYRDGITKTYWSQYMAWGDSRMALVIHIRLDEVDVIALRLKYPDLHILVEGKSCEGFMP